MALLSLIAKLGLSLLPWLQETFSVALCREGRGNFHCPQVYRQKHKCLENQKVQQLIDKEE